MQISFKLHIQFSNLKAALRGKFSTDFYVYFTINLNSISKLRHIPLPSTSPPSPPNTFKSSKLYEYVKKWIT